jgi:hypothetical protein
MFHVSTEIGHLKYHNWFLPNHFKGLKASSVFRYQSATDGRYRGAIKTSLSTCRHDRCTGADAMSDRDGPRADTCVTLPSKEALDLAH